MVENSSRLAHTGLRHLTLALFVLTSELFSEVERASTVLPLITLSCYKGSVRPGQLRNLGQNITFSDCGFTTSGNTILQPRKQDEASSKT